MAADASYACFSTFCFVVLCSLSSRYGMDPVRLFSLAFGFECAGGLAGLLLADGAALLGVGAGTFVGCPASVVTVAFVCLPSNADYRTAWGTCGDARASVESITSFYYSLLDTCTAVARSSGLSKREEEVLVLLVQRKSAPDIAAELCISTATVKSHSRGIYRKLGIHRREELLEMVGYPVEGPAGGSETR